MGYENGLLQLETLLKDNASEYLPHFYTLKDRLNRNEEGERLFGQSENTHHEHSQIICDLNEFALTHSNMSFDELCRTDLTPSAYSETEIFAYFKEASSIGKQGLSCEIAGQKIPRQEVGHILELLEQGEKSVLLTDGPGAGKSWILIGLADRLEANEQWGVLFLKGDRYDDIDSEQALIERLHFPDDPVKLARQFTASRKVVVLLDSLDALSLSQNQTASQIFLSLLDRFEAAEGIQVVAACRHFDLSYDPQLRHRKWGKKISIAALDFDTAIAPILQQEWQIEPEHVPPEQKALLTIPGNLKLFASFAGKVPLTSLRSTYHFLNTFLEEVVRRDPKLGDQALSVLQDMAVTLFDRRSLFISREGFGGSEAVCRLLQSSDVLQFDSTRNRLAFTHQTLLDTLITKQALVEGKTLSDFILSYPPFPFIRPAIRAFIFSLRAHDPERFRSQVKQVLAHSEIAYHLKRLIAESLTEIHPVRDDIPLCKWLSRQFPEYFRDFLWSLSDPCWFDLLAQPLFMPIIETVESDSLRLNVITKLRQWMNDRPKEVLALWNKVISGNNRNIANEIISSLDKFTHWDTEGIRELLKALLNAEKGHDTLSPGKSFSQYVEVTDSGDDLLWDFITAKIDETKSAHNFSLHLGHELRCSVHDFHNDDFLRQRLCASDCLLTRCIESLEFWSAKCYFEPSASSLRISFLRETSWVYSHHKHEIYGVSHLYELLAHIEWALKERCRKYDSWWQENEPKLRETHDASLAYLLMRAYCVNIEPNISRIIEFLRRADLFHFERLEHEVREFFHEIFPFLPDEVQEEFQEKILNLSSSQFPPDEQPDWILRPKYLLLCQIPIILRLPIVQVFIEEWQDSFGISPQPPKIYSEGGKRYAPISASQLLLLSDDGLLKLFHFYDESKIKFRGIYFLEQGTEGVIDEFMACCSLNPGRALHLIERLFKERIYCQYANALLKGIARYLSYLYGKLRRPQDWDPVEPQQEAHVLSSSLLKWLHQYPDLWEDGHAVATALEACSYVVKSPPAVRLLIRYLSRLAAHHDPEENSENLEHLALNSVRGNVAQGAMNLAIQRLKDKRPFPESLFSLLLKFAQDPVAGVRTSILFDLPHFTSYDLEKGWQLFATAFEEPDARLWHYAGEFLYYSYHWHFNRVQPYLERMKAEDLNITGGLWSRIQTLAYLSGHVTESQLFEEITALNHHEVWSGASLVFSTNIDKPEHRTTCEEGILRILHSPACPYRVISEIDGIFDTLSPDGGGLSLEIAEGFIGDFQDVHKLCNTVWFFNWLASLSENAPLAALHLCEMFLNRIEGVEPPCRIFHGDGLISAYLQIMREADLSDDPELITRAISLQDRLLELGLHGMWDALNKAGRP